jgi:hypothetical protein
VPDDLKVKVSVPSGQSLREVKLTERLGVYSHFTARATGSALPFDVDVEAKFANGRFRVEKLVATKRPKGDDITTDGLRRVPVGRILQHAIEKVVLLNGVFVMGRGVIDRAVQEVASASGPDDKVLILVATLYRLAYAVNVPPTAYVSERLGLPKSTAGRYVGLARKAGHLGPALGTKAGEG